MKERLHIPAITALTSTDATAIRQITLSLVDAIEDIKKDLNVLIELSKTTAYTKQRNNK